MHLPEGKTIVSDSGKKIQVGELFKSGGQAMLYHAVEVNSGEKGVLKVFLSKFNREQTIQRIQFLIGQRLDTLSAVIKPPKELVINKTWVAHFTPFVAGQTLDELLDNPDITLSEAVSLAIMAVRAVKTLHDLGIANGDLHEGNFIIARSGKLLQMFNLDLDNFNAPGIPSPPCIGQDFFMAPELRLAMKEGRNVVPDIHSDLFSLGVLIHEILLLKHIASGVDDDPGQFERVMSQGNWVHHPAFGPRPTDAGGYPAEILNADMLRMFQDSLSREPGRRPSAAEWQNELLAAVKKIYVCPNSECHCPCFVDTYKTICPVCKRPYPTLKLVTDNNKTIRLNCGSVRVGRAELGASSEISSAHAIFKRIGPQTWIEPLGLNGTFIQQNSSWVQLPNKQPALIQDGDILCFAGIQARVVTDN